MPLRYYRTFIDVEMESEETKDSHRRAKSCPPGSQKLETFELEEEVTRRANVKELEDRAKELTLKRDSPGPSDPLAGALSRGSYGHPELCRRPCLFIVQKQECLKGASCDFCHLEHSKLPSLDGLQRRTLSSLSQSQLLPVLIAPLRAKVQGGRHEAAQVLQLLESSPAPSEFQGSVGHALGSAMKVLKKMSLMALLGVLTKYIVEEPLAERLKEAVADVRGALPQKTQ